MTGFQCICGLYILLRDGAAGRIPCPQCGTEWFENSVRLPDKQGTTFYLEENGRWRKGKDNPRLAIIPVSRFFGEEE